MDGAFMTDLPVNAPRKPYAERAKRKLSTAIAKDGSARKFARRVDVNILYVTQFLKDGVEPTDQTEKGRAARVKIFLPKWKPRPRKNIGPRYLPGERKVRHIITVMARRTEKEIFRR
jgi:hypothetical protein